MSMEAEEKWLPVLGFETSYEVSNLGRVRSIDKLCSIRGGAFRLRKGKILNPKVNKYGYLVYNLSDNNKQKTKRIGRLVLEAFKGPQPTLVARHLDGNKLNNRLSNLDWGTQLENEQDKISHGTRLKGEQVGNSKLAVKDVIIIRSRIEAGETQSDIAREYGLSTSTVNALHKRVTWGHI